MREYADSGELFGQYGTKPMVAVSSVEVKEGSLTRSVVHLVALFAPQPYRVGGQCPSQNVSRQDTDIEPKYPHHSVPSPEFLNSKVGRQEVLSDAEDSQVVHRAGPKFELSKLARPRYDL